MADRILVAQIGAAHGIHGEVRLRSFTADPAAVKDYGPLENQDRTQTFAIERLRPGKDCLVVRFAGINDRTAAERLRNTDLYVARERLPVPAADEFYYADLVGLKAETTDGRTLGAVVAVHNFGAGDLIEVKPSVGASMMLPFTAAVVPVVDLAAGRIVVVPPGDAVEDVSDESQAAPPSLPLPHKGGGDANG